MAGKIDQVRALFEPGQQIRCVDNTYHRSHGDPNGYIGKVWNVDRVGKTVWFPEDGGFRGTFPERASDVLYVDDFRATWKIGRADHTVTYSKVAS